MAAGNEALRVELDLNLSSFDLLGFWPWLASCLALVLERGEGCMVKSCLRLDAEGAWT